MSLFFTGFRGLDLQNFIISHSGLHKWPVPNLPKKCHNDPAFQERVLKSNWFRSKPKIRLNPHLPGIVTLYAFSTKKNEYRR